MARSALLRADPETASVTEIARNHQFLELGRFAVALGQIAGDQVVELLIVVAVAIASSEVGGRKQLVPGVACSFGIRV